MFENNKLYSVIIGFEVLKFALIAYLLVPMPQMPAMASMADPGKEAIVVDCYIDLDGDGFGFGARYLSELGYCPPGLVVNNDDSDPNNHEVHPGAAEPYANSIDDNCESSINDSCNTICLR